jgi:hypothetical protein
MLTDVTFTANTNFSNWPVRQTAFNLYYPFAQKGWLVPIIVYMQFLINGICQLLYQLLFSLPSPPNFFENISQHANEEMLIHTGICRLV